MKVHDPQHPNHECWRTYTLALLCGVEHGLQVRIGTHGIEWCNYRGYPIRWEGGYLFRIAPK